MHNDYFGCEKYARTNTEKGMLLAAKTFRVATLAYLNKNGNRRNRIELFSALGQVVLMLFNVNFYLLFI
jgi:hypothetical protein